MISTAVPKAMHSGWACKKSTWPAGGRAEQYRRCPCARRIRLEVAASPALSAPTMPALARVKTRMRASRAANESMTPAEPSVEPSLRTIEFEVAGTWPAGRPRPVADSARHCRRAAKWRRGGMSGGALSSTRPRRRRFDASHVKNSPFNNKLLAVQRNAYGFSTQVVCPGGEAASGVSGPEKNRRILFRLAQRPPRCQPEP